LKKKDEILSMLETTAGQSGIKVIYENRYFIEGYCRLNGMYYLVFNRKTSFEKQIKFYRTVFGKMNAENIYLPPVIREILEDINE